MKLKIDGVETPCIPVDVIMVPSLTVAMVFWRKARPEFWPGLKVAVAMWREAAPLRKALAD